MKKMTYDRDADAAYIYLTEIKPGTVKKTITLGEDILVDVDKGGKMLGIEILSASKHLKKDSLARVAATA